MRLFFLCLFYINLLLIFCESKNKKVICDSPQNIVLNENEIVFIESPDFPTSMTETMIQSCTLNIFGKVIDGNSMYYLSIVLTNGDTNNDFVLIDGSKKVTPSLTEGYPYKYNTNSSSIIFTYDNQSYTDSYVVFQGYIFFEKYFDNINCDLVKIAKPLLLAVETEIICIYTYLNNITCSWNFIAPKNYGFKFTSITADPSEVILIVKNSSDYIITDVYTKSNLPYYNVDHNITIILNTTASTNRPFFKAFISIVKKNFTRTIGNCAKEDNGRYLTWSSSLYPNNAYCNLTTTILSKQQLFATSTMIVSKIENLADPITLEIGSNGNNIIMFTKEPDCPIVNVFGPYENGTAKNLFWEFLSDGSITSQGFSIDFRLYECECNNLKIIVPCESVLYYTLINTKKSIFINPYSSYYCANMNCIFKINMDETCSNKFIITKLTISDATPGNSIFKLISNNKTLADLCKTTEKCNTMSIGIIKPNSYTTLEFSSGADLEIGTFDIKFQAYEKFKVLPTIIVTKDIPWQALDPFLTYVMTLIPIELSDELKKNNDSLQFNPLELLFAITPLGYYFQFYSDMNLTEILPIEEINSMHLKSFVIFIFESPQEEYNHFFVSAKNASNENCKFHQTIFYVFEHTLRQSFSMVSNDQGRSCKVVIVNYLNVMAIETLWTTANESQVEIFSGLNYQNKLIQCNKISALHCQSLALTSTYYVIKIPANSSIVIETSNYQWSPRVFYFSSPCVSLVETYLYGSLTSYDPYSKTYLTYIIQNITVQFTVHDYDISKNGTLGFVDALGNKIKLTGVNQTVEYFSTNVSFVYEEPENGYRGARIYLKAFHQSTNKLN